MTGDTSLRLDKWLWYARFFKTRTAASKMISSGKLCCKRQAFTKDIHFGVLHQKMFQNRGSKKSDMKYIVILIRKSNWLILSFSKMIGVQNIRDMSCKEVLGFCQ